MPLCENDPVVLVRSMQRYYGLAWMTSGRTSSGCTRGPGKGWARMQASSSTVLPRPISQARMPPSTSGGRGKGSLCTAGVPSENAPKTSKCQVGSRPGAKVLSCSHSGGLTSEWLACMQCKGQLVNSAGAEAWGESVCMLITISRSCDVQHQPCDKRAAQYSELASTALNGFIQEQSCP